MTAPSPHQPHPPLDPLNQAALEILPPDAIYGNEAPLVSLLRLGLEKGLLVRSSNRRSPDHEQVEEWIELLSQVEHVGVATFLSNPERMPEEDCYLSSEMLLATETPEEAAAIVLDALVNTLVVRLGP